MNRNLKLTSIPLCQYRHRTLFCQIFGSCPLSCSLICREARASSKAAYAILTLCSLVELIFVLGNRRCDLVSLTTSATTLKSTILTETPFSCLPPFLVLFILLCQQSIAAPSCKLLLST